MNSNNKELLAESYFNQNVISKGLPSFMIIEPTNFCNLKCIMCPYPSMVRKKTHMDFDLYKDIINQVQNHVEFIWLHLYSESLLNENIYKMIDYAENRNVKTGLSTNATLLNDKNINLLLNTQLDILIIAMDGLKKDTYENIRRGATFEKTKSNIENFMYHKNCSGSKMKVVMQCINMKQTKDEINIFKNYWSKFKFENILIKNFHNFAGQIDSINILNNVENNKNTGNKICYEPWTGITVQSNGDVVPCCNDYDGRYLIGNCNTEPIKKLWNNDKTQELRRMFIKNSSRSGTLYENCSTPCTKKENLSNCNPFESYTFHSKHFLN